MRDTDFRRWWAEHDVIQHTYGVKRLRHPVVGDLTLDYEALTVTDAPAGSPSERDLRLLADLPLSAPVSLGADGQRSKTPLRVPKSSAPSSSV
ncbi:hypothetical protein [Amycolatopsis sp.]|uniref:MmyB family transcriptional regulator n=1 Tax=Amycolatopsis sp. TaxID=37632 RepID=UPI00262EF5F6|nr:hypothetical protein [Amycolatopsis sp.]